MAYMKVNYKDFLHISNSEWLPVTYAGSIDVAQACVEQARSFASAKVVGLTI